MERARRLYLYFVSAVSLLALAIGLANLLESVFGRITGAWTRSDLLAGDPDSLRRQLSANIALILVALPIWSLHWWLAERSLRPSNPAADEERVAESRSLYLALVLLVSFAVWLLTGMDLLSGVISDVTGPAREVGDFDNRAGQLATLFVAAAVWAYHVQVRLRDTRVGPLPRGSDWWLRLYVYIAAFVGAMLLVFGVSDILQIIVDVVLGEEQTIIGVRWWGPGLADSIARITIGFIVWAIHWGYALHLLTLGGWQGERERRSGLRRFYVYLVAFAGIFATLLLVTDALEAVLRAAVGATEPGDEGLGERFLNPLAGAIPFAVAWYIHRTRVLAESRQYDEIGPQATVRRIYTYVIALIGLALAGFGLAGTISVVIDRVADGAGALAVGGDPWRAEISRLAALTVVGSAAWLWHWRQAQRWVEADPVAERGATVRRAYLYIALAAAIIALLASLAIIAYRVLAEILGVASGIGLGSDLSVPVGVAVVAGALLVYHLAILRADLRTRMQAAPEATIERLIITGPPGANLDAVVAGLQAQLPDGYSLRPIHRGD